MNNCILIGITEIKQGIDKTASIEDRFRDAIRQAKNHWLVTNEDDQFKVAVGAILVTATEEEKERINKELDDIKTANALISGVSVDIEAYEISKNPIGIMKIWQETDRRKNNE